jgi:hypothetical protein
MHYRPKLMFNESPKGCAGIVVSVVNAQVFATEAEALASASNTFHNWMNPRISGFTTEETSDPVNYAWIDGNLCSPVEVVDGLSITEV